MSRIAFRTTLCSVASLVAATQFGCSAPQRVYPDDDAGVGGSSSTGGSRSTAPGKTIAVGGSSTGGHSSTGGVGGLANSGGTSSTGDTSGIAGSPTSGGTSGIAGSQAIGGNSGVGGSQSTLTGGTPGTSTATSTGGKPSSGGSSSASGGTSTGGTSTNLVTGGAPTVGGAATGGKSSTGGTSSTPATTSTGGVATGGKTATGGAPTTGGVATGGKTATGGAPTTGGVATGGAATGGVPATGGSSQISCTGGKSVCGSTCADLQTDKAHCGTCQTACEGYQFCSAGACLPHYVSTRILPATASASDSDFQVRGAAVEMNKAQGDLVVQLALTNASVVMSDTAIGGTISSSSTGYGAGLARYTASGTTVWVRDLWYLDSAGNQPVDPSSFIPLQLGATGDIFTAYYQYGPPPSGPASRSVFFRVARINGNDATVTWTATYPYGTGARTLLPRLSKSDFLSFGQVPSQFTAPYSALCQIADQGTAATVSQIGTVYSAGAVTGADGATVWMWGGGSTCQGASGPINPWSSTTWQITSNPTQLGCYDAYLLGAQDNGTTIGPWMSEGDYAPTYRLAVDTAGDVIVAASAGGYTTFNGGQDFITSAESVLVKIDHTSGQILWRTPISSLPTTVLAAPGNRIVTMTQQGANGSPTPTLPYQISVFADADGSLLTSFSAGMMAQQIAMGKTDMFLLGTASSAVDFDPGAATDSQGSTPGIYISRFSF